MGCKYPALISAVHSVWACSRLADAARRPVDRARWPCYVVGWAIVMGPWLGKNVIDTGNPVYPLANRVFHGRHWDAAREAKWSAAHGRRPVTAERALELDRRRRRPVRLAVAALRGAGAVGLVAAGLAAGGAGALGVRRLPLSHLVALDSPARPVLAAALAAAGDPGGPGGRLVAAPRSGRSSLGRAPGDRAGSRTSRTDLDGAGGPQRVDRRPGLAARDSPGELERAACTGSTPSCPPTPGRSWSARPPCFISDTRSPTTPSSTPRRSRCLPAARAPKSFADALHERQADPHLRRLERDRAASPARRLRIHRLRHARAIRRLGRRRRARTAQLNSGLEQELYTHPDSRHRRAIGQSSIQDINLSI